LYGKGEDSSGDNNTLQLFVGLAGRLGAVAHNKCLILASA
jgi:hypothetical protein